MFRFGKIAMSSFIFQLKIDQKGFMGWLGLIKLLWVKKGYYENKGLARDCIKGSEVV